MNKTNAQLWKLPLALCLAGLLIRLTDYISSYLLIKSASAWTPEVAMISFGIIAALSLVLFFMIGLQVHKIYSPKACFLSASLVVGYHSILFVLQLLLQQFGVYRMIVSYLFIPVELFSIISQVLVQLIKTDAFYLLYIPSIFAPYLFLLFTRREKAVSSRPPCMLGE